MNDKVTDIEDTDNGDSRIIESEAITEEESSKSPRSVIGSIGIFITFILVVCALAGSIYLYLKFVELEQQVKTVKTGQTDDWEKSFQQLKSQTDKRFGDLSVQFKKITDTNDALNKQLAKIEVIAKTIQESKGNVSDEDAALMQYDDTFIIQQIDSIRSDMKLQENKVSQLSTDIKSLSQQYSQSMDSVQNAKGNILSEQSSDQQLMMAILKAADIQLNVNSNIDKSISLLKQAKNMALNTGTASGLADEIDSAIQSVQEVNIPDLAGMAKHLDELKWKTLSLFSQQSVTKNETSKGSSWYENLIVIRKVEDSEAPANKEENQQKADRLQYGFEAAKQALLQTSQSGWNEELTKLIDMINSDFSETGKEIIEDLIGLRATVLNPEFPNLQPLMDRLADNKHSQEESEQAQDKREG